MYFSPADISADTRTRRCHVTRVAALDPDEGKLERANIVKVIKDRTTSLILLERTLPRPLPGASQRGCWGLKFLTEILSPPLWWGTHLRQVGGLPQLGTLGKAGAEKSAQRPGARPPSPHDGIPPGSPLGLGLRLDAARPHRTSSNAALRGPRKWRELFLPPCTSHDLGGHLKIRVGGSRLQSLI